jgi:hypothetical protein
VSSVSGFLVAGSWVDVGSFRPRVFIIFMIFTASVRNILDIDSYFEYEAGWAAGSV